MRWRMFVNKPNLDNPTPKALLFVLPLVMMGVFALIGFIWAIIESYTAFGIMATPFWLLALVLIWLISFIRFTDEI